MMKNTTLPTDHIPFSFSPASKRLAFVREWRQRRDHDGRVNLAELCRQYGISRKTGYKWLQRWNPNDPQCLNDRSRTPHRQPRRTSEDIIQMIVKARREHPRWGPRRLRAFLAERAPHLRFPAESTFGLILRREGLVGPSSSGSGHRAAHDGDTRRIHPVVYPHRTAIDHDDSALDLGDVPDLVAGATDLGAHAPYHDAGQAYLHRRLGRVLQPESELCRDLAGLPPWAQSYSLVFPPVLEAILASRFNGVSIAVQLRRFVDAVNAGDIAPPRVVESAVATGTRGLRYVTDAFLAKMPQLQPVAETAQGPAGQRLHEAMDLIQNVSPTMAAFVLRFVGLCCLVDAPPSPRCSSGSFNRIVGLIFIRNAHLGTALQVADGLVHEAVHQLLFSFELVRHPLFPVQRPPSIRSPWSGNTLPPDAYVQACVVWFALSHFWRHACSRGIPRAELFLERARAGFVGGPITRPITQFHGDVIPSDTMAMLDDIEDRMAQERWPARRMRA